MKNNQPWQQYPLIKNELARVNQLIEKTIQAPFPDLETALKQMATSGGKYLRPSLLILAAKVVNTQKTVSNRIIKLASSIEILHMATLVHDDIIDDSNERRGNISIQAHFGKDIAVYAGDLLFTNFFDLMLDTVTEPHYMKENAKTMHHILWGELGQMSERFELEQTFEDYLTNVQGKTAALFRLAAEEGSYFAGGNEKVTKLLAKFGQNLGIAFQIVDDILDYTGGVHLNKPTLEDLATGVYSLPILVALNNPKLKQQLQPYLNKKWQITLNDIQAIQNIIIKNSIIDKTRQIAKKYTDQALANLQQLPSNSAKKLLQNLTQKLLMRSI